MSLLDTPQARALLDEAAVSEEDVASCGGRLTTFLERYLPLFYRKEQRVNAGVVIRGLLSDLERKTAEPVAYREGRERKPIQFFVGRGLWDDEKVMGELRRHVAHDLADPKGVIVFDPTSFPKKGAHSVGVKRQWCGRLGKTDNCQVGVFMAYATKRGHGPLDRRLFLPKDWAEDGARREECHVPEDVEYRAKWRIALDMLDAHGAGIPHGWITGDEDFGRPQAFRAGLRERRERYVLDVPCDTLVRDLGRRRPPRRSKRGPKRKVPFGRVDGWTKGLTRSRWKRFKVRDGEKGPIEVEATETRVRTMEGRKIGPEERLVVIRSVEEHPRVWYMLSNAPPDVPPAELVRVHAERHRIEQMFEEAKGETGLAHYEVRSWVGWHHHMTLSLLALWFVTTEAARLGGKIPRGDGAAGEAGLLKAAS
ncbi:MAG: IS701 family transposase [Planctomycetota bacterium]|jgi:SRSO17 transposase